MKTSVCLAVICVLAVFALSVEASHRRICSEKYTKLVRVPQIMTYTYYFWGRPYVYRYYIWVYKVVEMTRVIPCPVDCQWGDWEPNGEWSICSVTCGKGVEGQLLTREIKIKAAYGGKVCEGPSQKIDYRPCDMLDCPSTICKEKRDGHHTHLQICAKYIYCENGKAHVRKCADGTAWDRDSTADNKCTSDGLNKCEGIACTRGMIYPDQKDCTKYHICDHNRLHQRKCPDDQPYYDFQLNSCTFNKDACNKQRDRIEVLKCDDQFGNITDRAHCNKFYQCVHGKAVSQTCPPGTLFDPRRQLCDHKKDVTCINEEEEDDDDYKEEEPEPESCQDGEFLMKDDDLTVYYRCIHGKKVIQRCPSDLVFDFNIKNCVRRWQLTQ